MIIPNCLNDLTDFSYWTVIFLSAYGVILFLFEIVYKLHAKQKPTPIFICVLFLFFDKLIDKLFEIYARTLNEIGNISQHDQFVHSWLWAGRVWISIVAMFVILLILTKRLFGKE